LAGQICLKRFNPPKAVKTSALSMQFCPADKMICRLDLNAIQPDQCPTLQLRLILPASERHF
jgi:hypothetical protein